MRHPEEGRAPSLTPNLVYATILEFHAAPNGRLANVNSKAHNAFGPAFGRRTWSIRILNGEQLVYS